MEEQVPNQKVLLELKLPKPHRSPPIAGLFGQAREENLRLAAEKRERFTMPGEPGSKSGRSGSPRDLGIQQDIRNEKDMYG